MLPSIMGQEEAHNDSTNPSQLIRLLYPNTCFPQSQENLDITNDKKKKKACLSNRHQDPALCSELYMHHLQLLKKLL